MLSKEQRAEIRKYDRCYRANDYGMGQPRQRFTHETLDNLPRGSLLDVGAGRGETMAMAESLGFKPVYGVEVVDQLVGGNVVKAAAWDLPFDAVNVVTCLDVMEHLLPEDSDRTIEEIARVTQRVAFFSIANFESRFQGMDLHVNKLPYDTWHKKLAAAFPKVERLPDTNGIRNANWLCWM